MSAEPARVECSTCLGYGHMTERGRPTVDRRCRTCLDCRGEGWVPAVLPSPMPRGRPPRDEGPTTPLRIRLSGRELAGVDELCRRWRCDRSEAVRLAIRRALAAAEEEG